MIINTVTPTYSDEVSPISYLVHMESGHQVEIPADKMFKGANKPNEDSSYLRDRVMDYLNEMYETNPEILFQKVD